MKTPQKLLEELEHRPSKKWGQNFLIQPNSVRQIVDWAKVPSETKILEIGPGLGAMTMELLNRGYDVTAIEIDSSLCRALQRELGHYSHFSLIENDFLKLDWKEELGVENFFVLANLPYSITTPILEKLIENRARLVGCSLLLQDEVVQRITAQAGDKNYGRLSVFLQNFFSTAAGPRISRNSFYPRPDVESRILRLEPKVRTEVPASMEERFFDLSRIIFSHPRKTLRKILLQHFGSEALLKIEGLNLDLNRRPATLTLEEIYSLAKTVMAKK